MPYGFDFDELYNLETDIYQPTNLASDPVCDKILREMARRMWQRIHETGDSHLDCLGLFMHLAIKMVTRLMAEGK